MAIEASAGATSHGSEGRPPRFSNGLKEFLWQLEGVGHGIVADFGSVSQSTVTYFAERGFKLYTEDMLAAWGAFLHKDEARLKQDDQSPLSPAEKAERFLASNIRYAADSFDGVLLWDVLDYLDRETAFLFLARISSLMKQGGAILTIFHMRMPEQFYRYRVLDGQNLDLVPATPLVPPQHIYQNREIQELFERFRSSKTFVGRDQLREGVFVK